jgi:hypothetical protein
VEQSPTRTPHHKGDLALPAVFIVNNDISKIRGDGFGIDPEAGAAHSPVRASTLPEATACLSSPWSRSLRSA